MPYAEVITASVGEDIKPFTEAAPYTDHVLCKTKLACDRIVAYNRNNGIGTFEQVQIPEVACL
jgi:hypothetical protein